MEKKDKAVITFLNEEIEYSSINDIFNYILAHLANMVNKDNFNHLIDLLKSSNWNVMEDYILWADSKLFDIYGQRTLANKHVNDVYLCAKSFFSIINYDPEYVFLCLNPKNTELVRSLVDVGPIPLKIVEELKKWLTKI